MRTIPQYKNLFLAMASLVLKRRRFKKQCSDSQKTEYIIIFSREMPFIAGSESFFKRKLSKMKIE